MNQQKDDNDFLMPQYEKDASADDNYIPEDAQPLCLNCLKPCNPLQNYCINCDSNEVVNPLASYMPFVRIRFEVGFYGRLWRLLCYDKEAMIITKLLCLYLMAVHASILLIVGPPMLILEKISDLRLRKTAAIILVAVGTILLLILFYLSVFQSL